MTMALIALNCVGPRFAFAEELVVPPMPKPGSMVMLSQAYDPAHLQGMTVHPDNALQFDFIMNKGEDDLSDADKKQEYNKLIKYFLASLTIADKDQWVNLSPYEKGRIIEDGFGKTEMGRDLLAQDYLLKQITSSLMYPESGLGKKFWDKVYERAGKVFQAANIPVNTFNKVWIMPDDVMVYESGNSAVILKSHLKVMLEEDYLAVNRNRRQPGDMMLAPQGKASCPQAGCQTEPGLNVKAPQGENRLRTPTSQVIRDIILPELEKEVNEGKNFASLRQIVGAMVLATWYKKALKESLIGKIYVDKAKVLGVDSDPQRNELIYQQYLKAFKKGAFNLIKEEEDKYTHQVIPRKYLAGGFDRARTSIRYVNNAMLVARSGGKTGLFNMFSSGRKRSIDSVLGYFQASNNLKTDRSEDIQIRNKFREIVKDIFRVISPANITDLRAMRVGLLRRYFRKDFSGSLKMDDKYKDFTVTESISLDATFQLRGVDGATYKYELKEENDSLYLVDNWTKKHKYVLPDVYRLLNVQPSDELSKVIFDQLIEEGFLVKHRGLYGIKRSKGFGAFFIRLDQLKSIINLKPAVNRVINMFVLHCASSVPVTVDSVQKTSVSLMVSVVPREGVFDLYLFHEISDKAMTANDAAMSGRDRVDLAPFNFHESQISAIADLGTLKIAGLGNIVVSTINGQIKFSLLGKDYPSHQAVSAVGRFEEAYLARLEKGRFLPLLTNANAEDLIRRVKDFNGLRPEDRINFLTKVLGSIGATMEIRSNDGRIASRFVLIPSGDKQTMRVITYYGQPPQITYVRHGEDFQALSQEQVSREARAAGVMLQSIKQFVAHNNNGSFIGIVDILGETHIDSFDPESVRGERIIRFRRILNTDNRGLFDSISGGRSLPFRLTRVDQRQWKVEADVNLILRETNGEPLPLPTPFWNQVIESVNAHINMDNAQLGLEAEGTDLGGIDLNSANFDMRIKRDGKGMVLPMPLQDMKLLESIEGFVPNIMEITPAVNVPILSEIEEQLKLAKNVASAT